MAEWTIKDPELSKTLQLSADILHLQLRRGNLRHSKGASENLQPEELEDALVELNEIIAIKDAQFWERLRD